MVKSVPFVFFDSVEAVATCQQAFVLRAHETAVVPCKLSTNLIGEEVSIQNQQEYSPINESEISPTNMPQVYETTQIVDENNQISITITNLENNRLHVPKTVPLAKVKILNESFEPSNAFPFCPEVNEIDTSLAFYKDPVESITKSIAKIKSSETIHEMNYMDFIENEAIADEMVRWLPEPIDEPLTKESFTEKQFLDMFPIKEWTPELKKEIVPILIENRQAFSHFSMDIRECKTYVHSVEIVGKPTLPKRRRIPARLEKEVGKTTENLISAKVMSRGLERRHYSNFVPIEKKDGRVRMCVDMIYINKHIKTTEKVCQMGSPKAVFDKIYGKKHVWSLDLNNAYFHVPVDAKTKLYYGIYSYLSIHDPLGFDRIIQGDRSSVFAFNKLISELIWDLKEKIFAWLDDLLLFTDVLEEMIKLFKESVELINAAGLSISPEKLVINRRHIKFLGAAVDLELGCKQIPADRVQAILDLPPPPNISHVKSLTSMLTYYHEHLPGLRAVARPIIELQNQGTKVPYKWTEEHQQSFLDIKELVLNHSALYFPDMNGVFSIWVDASDYNYHMALFNTDKNGVEKNVANWTGDFKGSKFNWGTHHKELFAVIEAINKYAFYLYHAKEVHLYTDAKALLYCAESKSDHVITYRLAMQLSGFNIHFHHTKGADNRADFLSRKWANYLEKKSSKRPKKRPYEEISQIVDRMEIKDYYTPEEVRILCTHNFKTPLNERYLAECHKKVEEILKDIKEKTRTVKVGCCDNCTIELHNIETMADEFHHELNFSTPPP